MTHIGTATHGTITITAQLDGSFNVVTSIVHENDDDTEEVYPGIPPAIFILLMDDQEIDQGNIPE